MSGIETLQAALTSVTIDPKRIKTFTVSRSVEAPPPELGPDGPFGLVGKLLQAKLLADATTEIIAKMIKSKELPFEIKTVDGKMVVSISLTVLKPET